MEVKSDTRQVDQGLDTSLAELLRVTNTGALKNKWRAQRTAAADNELPGLEITVLVLTGRQWLGWASPNTDGLVTLDQDLFNLGIDNQVEVLVVLPGTVDVSVSRVAAATRVTVDPFEPVFGTMAGDQVLEIVRDRNVLRLNRT